MLLIRLQAGNKTLSQVHGVVWFKEIYVSHIAKCKFIINGVYINITAVF